MKKDLFCKNFPTIVGYIEQGIQGISDSDTLVEYDRFTGGPIVVCHFVVFVVRIGYRVLKATLILVCVEYTAGSDDNIVAELA